MKKNSSFIDALNYRRSVRIYDKDIEIDSEIVKKCIKQATLAPNSSNMQLWEFYHITSKDTLSKLTKACLGQNSAATAKEMVVFVVRKDLWRKRVKTHRKNLEKMYGEKPIKEYSSREKFAFTYYTKIMPFTYADFLGLFGYIKYAISWVTGFFKPSYRQLRTSDMRVVAHKTAGLAAQTFMLSMAAEGYDTCPMEGSDTLRIKKIIGLPYKSEINMVVSCGVRKPEGVYGERFRIPFEDVYKRI
ncbi:MAG: nitroreductase family protein [Lutibacter sp.]|nr:MAG: nitroreductase family protein [Lutibacter sp.]